MAKQPAECRRRVPAPRPTILAPVAAAVLHVAAVLLSACGTSRDLRDLGDDQPTIATLTGKREAVAKAPIARGDPDRAVAAYRAFADGAADAPQRPEVLRRLADLEMEKVETRIADGRAAGTKADWQDAVRQYRSLLETYPKAPGQDRVLYQLARAHEQGGELEAALAALDRLVTTFPASSHVGEAQFRRGELLFTNRAYEQAQAAYERVLAREDAALLHERALYMRGWAQFKQSRLDEAVGSFLGVLDARLATIDAKGDAALELADITSLSRADRELLEDTFRVTSLALQNLKGAQSIPAFVTTDIRRTYEFRIHHQLAALYLKQERWKDAADTLGSFTRRSPLHARSPAMQAKVIEIYADAGFAALALQAKKDHVQHYGVGSDYQRNQPLLWQQQAQPLVRKHLAELARHHHAAAQKTKAKDDTNEAVRWYRALLEGFPADPAVHEHRFFLAELLHDDGRLAEAADEFEKVAYAPTSGVTTAHPRAADAGYAAVLDRVELARRAGAGATGAAGASETAQRRAVQAQVQFADRFATDARTAAVLAHATQTLHDLRDADGAAMLARRVLAIDPPAPTDSRRVALTVLAHGAFERGDFVAAEQRYAALLPLTAAGAARGEIVERQAASIYKQGESAREAGRLDDAARHFTRVAEAAPQSAVRANAQFDAAATLIAAKDWAGAARQLEDFRERFARHPLAVEVSAKLALAYSEQSRWAAAAAEYERLAATPTGDRRAALDAQWHAAQLYDKAAGAASDAGVRSGTAGRVDRTTKVDTNGKVDPTGRIDATAEGASTAKTDQATTTAGSGATKDTNATLARAAATRAYERFAAMPGADTPRLIEARWRVIEGARDDGQTARALVLAQALVRDEAAAADAARTPRTRLLASRAALLTVQPAVEAYRKVALVEPLKKQLEQKKARMQEVLDGYARVSAYGAAEAVTAATFHTAETYRDFGRALMGSQRPKKLGKLEREQYDVMLEEQAFPFEEKAIELHEANARRAADGVYDSAVKQSFAALRELRPARWARDERVDGNLESAQALEAAAKAQPTQATTLVRLGVAQRRVGAFDAARSAYERALTLDADHAAALLNLGILHDLYLGDAARATELYTRYLARTPTGDAAVTKWLTELKTRKPAAQVAARSEAAKATTPDMRQEARQEAR